MHFFYADTAPEAQEPLVSATILALVSIRLHVCSGSVEMGIFTNSFSERKL
jgi:hypothetical protein